MSVIDKLTIGVDFVRCSECDYKNKAYIRENMLVTAGARAAYMHDANLIKLSGGVKGEDELANFLICVVDEYLDGDHGSFDIWVEDALTRAYGEKGE